jgi:cytochrome c biogenesis protein CcdA
MAKSTAATRYRDLIAWMLHLTIYGLLLLLYLWLVLHFLAPAKWFYQLFERHRAEYALIGIVLMVVQAVVLETISAFVLRLFHLRDK